MLIERLCNDGEAGADIYLGPGKLHNNQPDPRHVRAGRTRVYQFRWNENGASVCEVKLPEDISRLLSIRNGYAPYGEEAEAEAKESYRWRPRADNVVPVKLEKAASGQPAIVEQFEDDDDDEDAPRARRERPAEDDNGLPYPPQEDADGDEWMDWCEKLIGTNKPKDAKPQLAEYAEANYGLTLDRSKGILVLLKQVAEAQLGADDAEAA